MNILGPFNTQLTEGPSDLRRKLGGNINLLSDARKCLDRCWLALRSKDFGGSDAVRHRSRCIKERCQCPVDSDHDVTFARTLR